MARDIENPDDNRQIEFENGIPTRDQCDECGGPLTPETTVDGRPYAKCEDCGNRVWPQ